MIELSPGEVFGGTVTVSTAIVMVLKRFGFLYIGKKSSANSCPDSTCQQEQKGLVQAQEIMQADIAAINATLKKDIFPKLNKTAEDTAFIRGKIEGMQHKEGP